MNNDKQLTPEEIREKASEFASYRRNKETNYDEWRLLWDGFHDGYLTAQQQTAAKDERIKALEEQHTYFSKREQELRAALDAEKKNAKEWEDLTIKWAKEADLRKKEGDARIALLEVDNSALKSLLHNNNTQYKARIAQLEKDANTMYEKMNGKIQFEKDKNKQLLEKVEQLKKERDGLKKRLLLETTDTLRIIGERDQAFDLLRSIQ